MALSSLLQHMETIREGKDEKKNNLQFISHFNKC